MNIGGNDGKRSQNSAKLQSERRPMQKIIISIIVGCTLVLIIAAASAEARNIVKIGGDVTVERNQKANNVIVLGGQVTVHGLVEHNVVVVSGSVVLANSAVVRGEVVCAGGVIVKGKGAQVFGDTTEINSANISSALTSVLRGELEGWSLILNIISLCFFAVIFIIALLMTILIPRPLMAIAQEIQHHKVKSFSWGLLSTMMMVPFFMLLVISLIGITLIPLAFTLLLLAFILGYIAAGTLIGNFILLKIFRRQNNGIVGKTLLGLILLWLIAWIPYIGWLTKILALTFGFGGVILALFSRRAQPSSPPLPPATPAEAAGRAPEE